jgi:predicted PurR-regulated permease PerM
MLEERGVGRMPAVLLAYVVGAFVVGIALFFLIPVLVVQLQELIRNFPRYLQAASGFVAQYSGLLERGRTDANLAKLLDSAIASLQASGVSAVSQVPAYTLSAFGLLLNMVLAPLIAFYALKDLHEIRETLLELIPERHRDETVHMMHEIDAVVAGFLRGQSLIALSIAVLSTIVLLVMRVDYPVVIGLITGVLSVIPYFGPLVGAIIAGIVALFKLSPLLTLITIALLVGVQQLVNMTIAPQIMSQQVNVHPIVVIFALLVGGTLFGIVGFILAIPVAAIGKAVFVHFAEGHHGRFERLEGAEPEPEGTH